MAIRREFPDVDEEDQSDRYRTYGENRVRHRPLDYPTGTRHYYLNGEPYTENAYYRTNCDVDSDYYKEIFSYLPDDPRRFHLDRFVGKVERYRARAAEKKGQPFDEEFSQVLADQNIELSAYRDDIYPNPNHVEVDDVVAGYEAVRKAGILHDCTIRYWVNPERGGTYLLGGTYKETNRDGDKRTSQFNIRFQAVAEDKPFKFGYLWEKIRAYFERNPHSGWRADLLEDHKAANNRAKFCTILTGFVKAMLFSGIPAEKVLDWFLRQEYHHGAGRAHNNKDIDSHVLASPPICVLFYFLRGLQQAREAKGMGVRRALERTRPFLSTGAPMREPEDEKKSRFIARFLVQTTHLKENFEEDEHYAPAGRLRRRDNGLFFRQKLDTNVSLEEWAQLVARAQHFASFFYGQACGSPVDQCVYSAYDIKAMMKRDGRSNFLRTGYLAFQQYEISLTGCQYSGMDLSKDGFEVVHPRHPYRHVLDYYEEHEAKTCTRPQVLYGFGEAVFGEMLVEQTFCQTHRFDPEHLHLEWVPRYFSREEEKELQQQEEQFLQYCPLRYQRELWDVREETAFKYAARRRTNDPFHIRHI